MTPVINAGLSCKYGLKKQQYINTTAENQGNANFIYNGSAIRIGKISEIINFIQDTLDDNKGFLYQYDTNYIMIKSEKSFTSLASRAINGLGKLDDFNIYVEALDLSYTLAKSPLYVFAGDKLVVYNLANSNRNDRLIVLL